MASDKEYLDYVFDLLREVNGVTYKDDGRIFAL